MRAGIRRLVTSWPGWLWYSATSRTIRTARRTTVAEPAEEKIAEWVYVAAAWARLTIEHPTMVRRAPGFANTMARNYAEDPAFRAAVETGYRNGRTALLQMVVAYRYTSPTGEVKHFHPADITLIL